LSQIEEDDKTVNDDDVISQTLFTDFNGILKARLSAVIPNRSSNNFGNENAPISAKYDCRIKVQYHKNIMSLIEEGMIFAVRNFKNKNSMNDNSSDIFQEKYTLLVASRIWPDHYGLRGISDHTYYPMQFEVIEQSVTDWDTEDNSTMMIQISAIPINYDLVVTVNQNKEIEYEYEKGFTYPVIGDSVYLLNAKTVSQMYNQKVLKKMNIDLSSLSLSEQEHLRIGTLKMFEESDKQIQLYINFDNLVRYHFGIFSFTGGGKSNLLSNLLRKILQNTHDTKIILFDISSEYSFLLSDIFTDESIKSKIILENEVKNADQFNISVVKPREFEDDERAKKGLTKIFDKKIVTSFVKPYTLNPKCKEVFAELERLKIDITDKPHYLDCINQIQNRIFEYMMINKLTDSSFMDENFVKILTETAMEAIKTFRINDKSNLYGWAHSRTTLSGRLKKQVIDDEKIEGSNKDRNPNQATITEEEIIELLEGDTRLICISISDPYIIKNLAISISKEMLKRRKRQFKVKPHVLFVFDEAQEFVRDLTSARGTDKDCSEAVETLLRQGRKYGLGGCIATQRIAYLNTSALQQLHTYFVGTLPRPYDRNVVSNTFTIDNGILEKTLEFSPGEWLLSSYIATGIENVPIFIKSENSEKEIEKYLES
jgi:DNA helicase HerA-like ATPase